MKTAEFKKIARLLKQAYAELEQEAIKEGLSPLSAEYDQLVAKVREVILKNNGFTLEEYRAAKAKVAGFSQSDLVDNVEVLHDKLTDVEGRHIPTEDEIESIARRVAQEYVVPPQVTNQIVKEIVVEKPIKETRIEHYNTVEKEEYNDEPLQEKLGELSKKVDEYKKDKDFKLKDIKEDLKGYLGARLEENINTLDMPNFRKLAMGLQGQIDELRDAPGGSGTSDHALLTHLDYASAGHTGFEPAKGADDNFVTDAEKVVIGNTSGTNTGDNATNSQYSGLAASKADVAGSLTQFVGNTAWRVFYSDTNGDVTELALGADGTFLKSNGAAVAPSFATPAGSGDVSKVGTPVNNQVGVWTGDGTLEGDADLTFDTSTNTLATGIVTVSDEAYGAGWNGSLQVPTKNAVYDKIETISGGGITEELAIAYAVSL